MSVAEASLRDLPEDGDGPDGSALGSVRAGGAEMAVAGFVLSVLWLFFLGSIAGLCLGAAARRRLAADRSAGLTAPAPAAWVGKLAIAAIAIGGLGTAVGIVLAALQVLGAVNITAACHPVVTGVSCRLVFH